MHSTNNPFALPVSLWQASLTTDAAAALGAESAFEAMGALAVQRFVADEAAGFWRVEATFDGAPDAAQLEMHLAIAMRARIDLSSAGDVRLLGDTPAEHGLRDSGGKYWDFVCAPLPTKNWVLEVEQRYPPMALGRFFVHASHYEGVVPAGLVPLLVDAGMAFGTGEHATTAGCLLAISRLHKAGLRPERILDMGCGSGILAMAAHKLWPQAAVLGVDIDPVAVEVARANAALNRCRPKLLYLAGDGYQHRLVHACGPYDLIIANILARPLMRMAKDLARVKAPGGAGVLSGLLNTQERMVLSAHRMQGMALTDAVRRNGWSALTIR